MIKNDLEKKGIESKFRKFLNSLEFKIQIVIGTNYLNLDNYVNALELRAEELSNATKNYSYLKHFDSYKEHLLTSIKDKSGVNP